MSKTKRKKLIPLSYDLVFKKMFGDINHPERTATLISTFLNIPYEEVKGNIELLPTEKRIRNKNDKRQDQDLIVKIVLSVNKKISLEMNMTYDKSIIDRNNYYLAGMFYNQLKNKDDYSKLIPCIQINFNTVFTDTENKVLFDEYSLRNKYCNELTDMIKIYNVNIEECRKIVYNEAIKNYDQSLHNIIKYGAMLMEKDYDKLKDMLEGFKMEKDIKEEILDTMEEYSEDEELGLWYDVEEEKRKIEQAREYYRKQREVQYNQKIEELQKKEESIKEKEESIKEKEESIKEKEESIKEKLEHLQQQEEKLQEKEREIVEMEKLNVKEMLDDGLSISIISKYTKLTEEEIKNILENED